MMVILLLFIPIAEDIGTFLVFPATFFPQPTKPITSLREGMTPLDNGLAHSETSF